MAWSASSAGVAGRMGDTVLPDTDKREVSAGQGTQRIRGTPPPGPTLVRTPRPVPAPPSRTLVL
ncbi:hypothetical protein TNCT6_38940 [Streptomyces sp. 6-11-2]|nr:hypothetical protein TNCT6_38940 [Streptomyces sp. 6-11-2]